MRNCHICFWLSASSAGRQQGSVNYSVSAQGTAQRANELLLHLSVAQHVICRAPMGALCQRHAQPPS